VILALLYVGVGSTIAIQETATTRGMVMWAIPNIQFPAAFAGGPVGVPSDAEVTRNLLSSALESGGRSASVRLSSAYLNLTSEMTSILTK
jgi:hypothetical protein